MIDVLVVGGGVAGSATAIHLARHGCSVVLVDRASFPRRKACGEGLFPRGVRELRDLGVLNGVAPFLELERIRFHAAGQVAEAKLGRPAARAAGVQRDLLDAALLAEAQSAGVEVRTGCRAIALIPDSDSSFSLLTDGGELEARAIVAADGLNSGLRRQAGLDAKVHGRRYGISAHVALPEQREAAIDVFFHSGFEVYVTPVGDRLSNVAVLMSKPLTRVLAGSPAEAFARLVRREASLGGWRPVDEPLVAGPFAVRAKSLWSRNLVLAGDAAGFFDGITGEGMTLALVSARHCAAAVKEYLTSGSEARFAEYESKRRALARKSQILGRLTLLLAARPWTTRRAVRGLARDPDAFSRLLAVSSGEQRLLSLKPMDLVRPFLG